ncbi:MarR family transcriptional regulator [Bacillus spongiae]|uniref:MarR family transcriptional regulator n=1 Tax=Bacillus spongiae TaxID=2683610 RepID=A0ABU8HKN1_9BACI
MNDKNLLKLDNQICFTIYAASREMTKLYRPLLDELELTYPQYLALLALWEHDSISVKELGQKLYLDSGTLTPMLKRMQANGLLVRERDKADERKVLIKLTEKGNQLQEKAECIPASLLKEEDIPSSLLHQLKRLLNSVHDINEKASQE